MTDRCRICGKPAQHMSIAVGKWADELSGWRCPKHFGWTNTKPQMYVPPFNWPNFERCGKCGLELGEDLAVMSDGSYRHGGCAGPLGARPKKRQRTSSRLKGWRIATSRVR